MTFFFTTKITSENLGVWDPFISKFDLLVKSMTSDGLVVLFPNLIVNVGQ